MKILLHVVVAIIGLLLGMLVAKLQDKYWP